MLSEWRGVTREPGGCGHDPSIASHSTGSWLQAPTHLPRPSPASCCAALAAVKDKINNPTEALADCSGGAGRVRERGQLAVLGGESVRLGRVGLQKK